MSKKPDKPKIGIALNMSAASAKIGAPLDFVKRMKDCGSEAFKSSGRIDCDKLLALWEFSQHLKEWRENDPRGYARFDAIRRARHR